MLEQFSSDDLSASKQASEQMAWLYLRIWQSYSTHFHPNAQRVPGCLWGVVWGGFIHCLGKEGGDLFCHPRGTRPGYLGSTSSSARKPVPLKSNLRVITPLFTLHRIWQVPYLGFGIIWLNLSLTCCSCCESKCHFLILLSLEPLNRLLPCAARDWTPS